MMDRISVTKENPLLVIEKQRPPLGEAIKQRLLSLKHARDSNCGGGAYGFTTTGKSRRVIGKGFCAHSRDHVGLPPIRLPPLPPKATERLCPSKARQSRPYHPTLLPGGSSRHLQQDPGEDFPITPQPPLTLKTLSSPTKPAPPPGPRLKVQQVV